MTTLEKIKTEIQKPMRKVRILDTETQKAQMIALAWCLEIIDKYAEQEPCDENLHREREQAYMQGYEDGKNDVLDKIRAEILALPRELPTDARNMVRRTRVLDIIDKYAEQEPCDDVVSRQHIIEQYKSCADMLSDEELEGANLVMKLVCNAPTVRPQEQIGHWIIIDDCEQFIAKCSKCGRIEDSRMISKYPYCHCGAKMVEPQESQKQGEVIANICSKICDLVDETIEADKAESEE